VRSRIPEEKHGLTGTAEHRAWTSMIYRCNPKVAASYPRYAGRGISVCERWRMSFTAFLADMGPRPSRKHSIDRIDNDGNYEPSNCRWATREEQTGNQRRSNLVTYRGRTQCARAWARELGINPNTLNNRIRRGADVKAALFAPTRKGKLLPRPLRADGFESASQAEAIQAVREHLRECK
jgi:hypothetical protein